MPLKDQEKIAWGWADYTDPTRITQDHILFAYRIKQNFCKKKPCRRNCRGNPYCLSGLGESRLLDSVKNSTSDDVNSIIQRRDEGCFAGLKNLGATCYVNSLLQLWFHNKAFRDAILSWNPFEDPEERDNVTLCSEEEFVPQSVVGHLQQLFAEMLHGKSCHIDPTPLVTSLRLDTSTQQDAQEFSKLLVSLIEKTLRHQSKTQVRDFITKHFKGEYMYVTRCCNCLTESVSESEFYELDLNVQGNGTLSACLAEFLHEEKLEGGAECYSCAVCHSKQEALRFIQLKSLPPILNLQLLRFVYDREKGQKKKVKSIMQFPETIDMRDFLKTDSREPLVYNLNAVLSHKGPKATSGHFIAHIRDIVSGAWTMFNDEAVVKLEGKRLKLEEEDPEGTTKKQKNPKLPKGYFGSTDAYMLVYVAENHRPSMEEVKLSDKLQSFVDERTSFYDSLWADIKANKEQNKVKQIQVLDQYNSLSVDDWCGLEEKEVLATDWLLSWLKMETPKEIDNTMLVCPHNLLDPGSVVNAKYVFSNAIERFYNEFGGGPRLKLSESLCNTCVTNTCSILRTKAQTQEESKEITNLLKRKMAVNEPGFYVDKQWLKSWRTKVVRAIEEKLSSGKSNLGACSANDDVPEQTNEEECNTVSEVSSAVSVKAQECNSVSGVSSDVPVTAQEGNPTLLQEVSQKKPNTRLRLTRNALSKQKSSTVEVPVSEIRNCFVRCKKLEINLRSPRTSSVSSVGQYTLNQCRQLTISLRRLSESTHARKPLRSRRRNILKEEENSGNPSAVKLEEKRKLIVNKENITTVENGKQMHTHSEEGSKLEEVEETETAFNERITCKHGNLTFEEVNRKLVPARVWEILIQYFPSAPTFPQDSEPCHLCQNESTQGEVAKQQLSEVAQLQKLSLTDLFNLRSRPEISKSREAIYVIDRLNFHQPWTTFIRSMTKKDGGTLVEPPSSLNMELLLCEHGMLLYSPWHEDDLNRLVLVTQQEWTTLTTFYTACAEISILPRDKSPTTKPELCLECFEVRLECEQKEKLKYNRAKLHIRMINSVTSLLSSEDQETSEPETQPHKRPRLEGSTSPVPPELKRVMKDLANGAAAGAGSGVVRRSARSRQRGLGKDHTFSVSSSSTLRELKQMITNQLAVAPFDQHLYTLEGKELSGDYETLADFRILPNTVLYLQVDEPKDSFEEDCFESCSAPTEPEVGFKGTGLQYSY